MEPLPDLTSALDHSPRRFVGLSKGQGNSRWLDSLIRADGCWFRKDGPCFFTAACLRACEEPMNEFQICSSSPTPVWEHIWNSWHSWLHVGDNPSFTSATNTQTVSLFPQVHKRHTKKSCFGAFWSLELTVSYQCVLRFFQSTCLKYCACHEKVMPGHTKSCTCHAKSSQQTWRSNAPKCNPSQEISARTS